LVNRFAVDIWAMGMIFLILTLDMLEVAEKKKGKSKEEWLNHK